VLHYTTAIPNRVRKSSNSFVKYTQVLCSTPRNDSGVSDTLAVVGLSYRLLVETGYWALRAERIEITFHLEYYYLNAFNIVGLYKLTERYTRSRLTIITDRALPNKSVIYWTIELTNVTRHSFILFATLYKLISATIEHAH